MNSSILTKVIVFLLQWVVSYLGKSMMYQLDLWLLVTHRTCNNWLVPSLVRLYKDTSPPTLFPPCRDTIGFMS